MATSRDGSGENGRASGGTGERRISTWLIIGLVALVLVGAFWLFDLSGADPQGDEIDGDTTDQGTDEEAPDVDFGEPTDGEGPDIETVP